MWTTKSPDPTWSDSAFHNTRQTSVEIWNFWLSPLPSPSQDVTSVQLAAPAPLGVDVPLGESFGPKQAVALIAAKTANTTQMPRIVRMLLPPVGRAYPQGPQGGHPQPHLLRSNYSNPQWQYPSYELNWKGRYNWFSRYRNSGAAEADSGRR